MKTRNWKLCILAIFLAVCFTVYAGNCNAQGWTNQMLDLPINLSIIDPWPGPDLGPLYPEPMQNLFDYAWGVPFVWTPPAGRITLELFQDLMPSLRYETFYNMNDPYGIDNLYEDYYGLPSPAMENWNLYQRTDLYSRPKRGEQTLYQFTKDFIVKPRKPDVYTSYGAYGGYAGYNGYGMGGLGFGGDVYGMSAGHSQPFGLGNTLSNTF